MTKSWLASDHIAINTTTPLTPMTHDAPQSACLVATSISSSAPRACFAFLPTELKCAIVTEVYLDDEPYYTAGPHVYEKTGERRHANLAALSEVDSQLAALCFPLLWRAVNLQRKNNVDLLYLLKIIIPRHGEHIESLGPIRYSGKPVRPVNYDYPLYILDQLGLSSNYGHAPSQAAPADVELFGQRLVNIPSLTRDACDPSKGATADTMLPRTDLNAFQSQFAQLMHRLLSPTSTPKLCEIELYFEAKDQAVVRHQDCFVAAVQNVRHRITKLTLNHFAFYCTVYEELDDELLPIDVTSIISNFSSLTSLSVSMDSTPTYPDYPLRFAKTVASLTSLKYLSLLDFRFAPLVTDQFAHLDWTAPLEFLELQGIHFDLYDLAIYLAKFKQTLVELHVELKLDDEPLPPGQMICLPKLTDFSFQGYTPPSFIRTLQLDSLREAYFTNACGTCDDWLSFLDRHASSLINVLADPDSFLTLDDAVRIDKYATEHGISLWTGESSWPDYIEMRDLGENQ